MEEKVHQKIFGQTVRGVRKRLKMSQIDFYNELLPEIERSAETIKKKMNAIENAKQKTIDWEFFFAFCEKYEVSADYALGFRTDYMNHKEEAVCEYTGLEKQAVQTLHKWTIDSNNGYDPSKMDEAIWGDDDETETIWNKMYEKQVGIQYLIILNYLFKETEYKSSRNNRKKGKRNNLGILHSLYTLSMEQPAKARVRLKCDEITEDALLQSRRLKSLLDYAEIDPEGGLMLEDSSHVWYPLDLKSVIERVAKENLMKDVDRLIEQVRSENKQRRQLEER